MVDLTKLNDSQKKAVEQTDGALMILAGAGSGKTRTLVSKIAYLLDDMQISAHQILAMTFSNKAAKEMRSRIASEVHQRQGSLQVTTFHAFCANLLRREATYIGLSRNFTIYDTGESNTIIKTILRRRGLSRQDYNPAEILYYIDALNNSGYYVGQEQNIDLSELPIDLEEERADPFWDFYLEYQQELHKANALDFGSLITAVIQLFETHSDVLANYQRRFQYILVDEYQDTNKAQFKLLNLLSKEHGNICVVGDEDQSIYSWRGANIYNILDFENEYPKAKLLKLEQNYRSSKNIIEAAGHVIERNKMRKGKKMWTDNNQGEAIEIVEVADDRREADFVAQTISRVKHDVDDYSDIAVFYRTNAQSRILEDALRKARIPYRIIGGIRFYERKEVKDMVSYLRLCANFKDNLAFSRIINVPSRGVGVTTLRKIEDLAVKEELSLWEAVCELVENYEKYKHIRLSAKVKSALSQFVTLISEGQLHDEQNGGISQLYDKLLNESGYYDSLKGKKDYESLARIEHLEELGSAIVQYQETAPKANLQGFLETITLDANADSGEESEGEVSLMTIHGAKGLEFPYAFIVGAEESVFPTIRSFDSVEGLEEERRLFYVAMTRAMKKLYIVWAQSRMQFGQIHCNGASRFIHEIPSDYYQWTKWKVGNNQFRDSEFSQEESFSQESEWDDEVVFEVQSHHSTYPTGTIVKHSLYGVGEVVYTDGQGKAEKVKILFPNGEKKTFVVHLSPLSVVRYTE